MTTIQRFAAALKGHLHKNQQEFVEHLEMCGDTEGGFYDEDLFDFDKLCAEIDRFAVQFKQ